MQQLFYILALSVAIVSGTRTPEALVLTFGDSYLPHKLKASGVSDNVVQRIIDLRMGSEISLTLGGADQDTIEMLNDLGGTPAPLFGLTSELDNPARDLLVLEGVEPKIASIIESEFQHNLLARVSSDDLLPHLSAFTSAAKEPGSLYTTQTRHCELHIGNDVPSDLQQPGKRCISEGSVFEESPHIFESALLSRASKVESWIDERASATTLKTSLQSFKEHESSIPTVELLQSALYALKASSGNRLVTAVFLPQPSTHRDNMALEPRAVENKGTLPRTTLPTSDAILQSNLLPVAPVCYASNSSCNELTKSCSGHGYCYRKFGSPDQTAASDCYACKCQETILRKDDGTIQKVRWGGPACHKRDISSPFFLIAGITILVLMATGAAVGMLYQIGQEQLPGVISAGVGTARTQK